MAKARSLRDAVAQSQVERQELIDRLGFVPMSILRLKRGELSRRIYHFAKERHLGSIGSASSVSRIDAFKTPEGKAKAEERRRAGLFGGVREAAENRGRKSISVMAPELVEFFVKYYAKPGDLYLDPFAGHGVRMQVAHFLGLRYEGVDCCEEYVRYCEAVSKRLGIKVGVRQGDSRQPPELSELGDFCFTSPPYWDVEFYGPETEQLGQIGITYDGFLDELGVVARAWLPKFRSGAFVVLNVNDLRRDKRFYPYHADVMNVFRSAGYELHDLWIIEGLVAGLPKAFAVSFNRKLIAPKTHEYAIVFRVP